MKTYQIYPCFGGGYEVWTIVSHRREQYVKAFWTKEDAQKWIKVQND